MLTYIQSIMIQSRNSAKSFKGMHNTSKERKYQLCSKEKKKFSKTKVVLTVAYAGETVHYPEGLNLLSQWVSSD